jgi:outer membrane protein TolC
MKSIHSLLFLLLVNCLVEKANCQDNTLEVSQLMELVRLYHPFIRKADIEIEKSKADMLSSRGGFDPVLSNYGGNKEFKGTNYYNTLAPNIKIPTWYGIEVSSGLESMNGDRLDPSITLGQTSYVGIKVPLAKNFLMDKRRAYLKQAKISNKMSEVEKNNLVNNVLMDAVAVYWEWVKAYQIFQLANNTVALNNTRFNFVKKSFINGERAAIDTIEALTQLQSFQLLQSKSLLDFKNAGLELSSFLWTSDGSPYELKDNIVPIEKWESSKNIDDYTIMINDLMIQVNDNHPALLIYDFKLNNLAIDKKLKRQDLLPKIDLGYQRLGKSFNVFNTIGQRNLFNDNYMYSLSFDMPLFL